MKANPFTVSEKIFIEMPQQHALTETHITEMARNALKSELMAAAIYKRLAEKYRGREISGKLEEFAAAEQSHAEFWAGFLERRNQNPDQVKINTIYVDALAFIYGLLGVGLTLKLLEAGEREAMQGYATVFSSGSLTPEERTGITRFLLDELAHEEGLTEYEANFRFFIGKIATIFTQTSGGLVLVLSTAIGLSGVYTDSQTIGVIGLIVGVTSALNTVVGFYYFGRTSRRLNQDILNRIKTTCTCAPEAYADRVKKHMLRRNYNEDLAQLIAQEAREKNLVETIIAEEEYGIKGALPDPMQSAAWAGVFKVIGTVLPLTPYLVGLPINVSIILSILITFTLLAVAGSLAAIAAEVSVRDKVVELVSGGAVLATLTYILGKSASFLLAHLNIG
jgi:VIT1/CCC1 family predicted Fe2+/Mn2+ transporter